LFTRAARSHAGIGKEFLQTDVQFVASLNREPLNRFIDLTIQRLTPRASFCGGR
jgi:hypothetical protein